jgi:predicted DNA-binding transcriptional regulator
MEMKVEPLESLLSATSENNQGIVSKVTEVDTKVRGLELAQERLIAKITGLEDEMQKFIFAPEMKSEPVMPIRRDKALATLTETEIMVLEMLLSEGSKTAPEIKERVGLSREHTARLMKKLYEEGYLERETGKIPFRYSAKQELEKFLKKPENQQA